MHVISRWISLAACLIASQVDARPALGQDVFTNVERIVALLLDLKHELQPAA